MRVLVTGASGFLGRATAAAVRDAGHQVRTVQRRPSAVPGVEDVLGSVTDPELLGRAVDGVDAVVHLAAKVSLTGDPADFARVNVDGTRSLLHAARSVGAGRFVFVSSPSVAHTGSSLAGVGAGVAEPERARGDYARTKAAAELLALAADGPDLAVVALRPHLVWGPGDTQLVGRIVERARRGRLPVLDSGTALIDTLYVDNAAAAMVAALEHAADESVHGNAYVVTNGEPRPVGELLAGICTASGVPAPRWHVPSAVAKVAGSLVESVWRFRPGADEPPMTRFLAEQLSTAHWFDQRRTRGDLQWSPSVSIDEGLERLAAER
ncbi:nucleoside-diphosphate sugar epimerase [Curtobacterium sp. 'Ferrero']|uniref:NAD-dependent epimerase/dehydratase family protein n=1 Tax=Curtobacterium sp. 'Ferrero' TaxID=2033654 RepID=UPI000BD37B09|nr:NAD-dependent epimerase/dehydratase family protein [Curtobacterium sp. 'Ferrero']PCN48745.1 nucleoside-diphosphate sugar epimerase [Curtobacterium sp. 'Ferrero']